MTVARITARHHAFAALSVVALLVSMVGVVAPPATAAFPGDNGPIVCASNQDGNFELYTYDADGSDPRRLTANDAADFEATWSPDGARIAFTSTRSGDQEIWTIYQDGSGLERLTFSKGEDRPGSFTPDGDKITFHSARFGDEMPSGLGHLGTLEIMVMDADGSNPERLTNNTDLDSFAHVSPDGSRIAFTTDRDDDFEIYTMNIDGSDPTRVTNSTGQDAHASWSPDGSQLVFHSIRRPHGAQLEIYRQNADGSGDATRLTNDDVAFDAFPVWSPDGTQIAWSRGYATDAGFTIDAFTMDADDGTAKNNVTDNAGGVWDYRCDWSRRLPCTVSGAGQIRGTDGDDVLCGSDADDRFVGKGGDDVVYAGDGDDHVTAGPGDDTVFGRHGEDRVIGGDGNDTLFGDQGDDHVIAGSGDDVASGSEGTDRVSGDDGEDECYGEKLSGCP